MANKNPENYMIRIHSAIDNGDGVDKVELATRGSFACKNGNYYITYKESETTGYAGCTTTLKIAEDESRVTMLRFGPASTQMVLEKGKRSLCHYETGYGSITLGVTADEIHSNLNEKGGNVSFSYMLDADNAELVSRSRLDVSVVHLN